jgi:hypothetical protein
VSFIRDQEVFVLTVVHGLLHLFSQTLEYCSPYCGSKKEAQTLAVEKAIYQLSMEPKTWEDAKFLNSQKSTPAPTPAAAATSAAADTPASAATPAEKAVANGAGLLQDVHHRLVKHFKAQLAGVSRGAY